MSRTNAAEAIDQFIQTIASHTRHGHTLFADDVLDISPYVELLKYGIEIEFSKCPGLINEPEDEDTIRQRAMECMADDMTETARVAINRHIINGLPCHNRDVANAVARIAESLANAASSLEDLYAALDLSNDLDDDADQYASNNGMNENTDATFDDVTGWTHCDDGTPGILQEYQLDGPMYYHDAVLCVDRLFDSASLRYDGHHVPVNGSCHIHISLDGVKHTVADDSMLHACIVWALFDMYDSFPECVQERMCSNNANRYFMPHYPPHTKFSAVHNHRLGTFEFRLFGHVNDTETVERCMQIAASAFIRGYYMFKCGQQNIGSNIMNPDTQDITAWRVKLLEHFEQCNNGCNVVNRVFANPELCPMVYNSWKANMYDVFANTIGSGYGMACDAEFSDMWERWIDYGRYTSTGLGYWVSLETLYAV